MALISKLRSLLGEKRLKVNYSLINLTTFKIKARAKYFFEAKTRQDLILAKKASLETGLDLLIIGGGSNLVFTDKLVNKLVVKNFYLNRKIINQGKGIADILFSSGYPLAKIVRETINDGYSGFEYYFGLPGSLGGAIYMNSKWMKPPTYIGDNLLYAFLVDKKGRIVKRERDYFRFKYGYSALQNKDDVLLEAVFRLKKANKSLLKKRAAVVSEYRYQTQPQGVFTAGCFFKNPSHLSAGYLIDKAGLKGIKKGAFIVSTKHANFIINQGGGKIADLLDLVYLIKKKVHDKFNVDLVTETELI